MSEHSSFSPRPVGSVPASSNTSAGSPASTNANEAGGCVLFPACGCADPFATRWPHCITPDEREADRADFSKT